MQRQSRDILAAADTARALRDRFAAAGFTPVAPPLLQPAEPFVDLSGEDIRRRLYLIAGEGGEELCLRPDFTIPVARLYLQGQSAELRRCCYAGPAFRRLREPAAKATEITDGEFHQAGIEVYGGEGAKTDAEVLGLCMEGVHGQGLERLEVRLGHPGLFAKLIEALDLPDGWRRRLRRHFVRQDVIDDLRQATDTDAGVARAALGEALSGLETASAVDLIEEVLALGGIEPVGGRTAEEIAARFMKRAAESAAAPSQETIALLDAYLKVKGPPDAALTKIGDLCAAADLDAAALLGELRGLCDSAGEVADRLGLGKSAVTFDAEFGRRLEYYTGFVFEIHDPGNAALRQIAGGGRYDRLLGDLGASEPLPAVGCAVYVDRLLAATGRGA